MTKHYLLLLVLLLLSIKLIADGVQPIGAGTSNDPYQITTLDNLLWMSTNIDSWSSHFVQTADIDASLSQYMDIQPIGYTNYLNLADWNPDSHMFMGHYDGQNHSINSLYIVTNLNYSVIGIFAGIKNAIVENLHIIDPDFSGSIMYRLGGIVGIARNSEIGNCIIEERMLSMEG